VCHAPLTAPPELCFDVFHSADLQYDGTQARGYEPCFVQEQGKPGEPRGSEGVGEEGANGRSSAPEAMMRPVLVVMLLLASALGGCAMPEPIPQADLGLQAPPEGDAPPGAGKVGPSDTSGHDRPWTALDAEGSRDAAPSPAGEGLGDGVKGDGLKLDGVKADGLKLDGKMPDGGTKGDGGGKKDAWSNDARPKG
jgi:hypothetical protein